MISLITHVALITHYFISPLLILAIIYKIKNNIFILFYICDIFLFFYLFYLLQLRGVLQIYLFYMILLVGTLVIKSLYL